MWLAALKASWKQNYQMIGRYLFNTISSIVTLYIVFALLFYGAKSIGAGSMGIGDTLEGMFAGYVTWMLALMGCTDLAYSISNEAQTGTLEQLCLSPVGYRWVMMFNQSFSFAFNILFVAVITVLMSLTTGQAIHLDLLSFVPATLAVYLQALGMGFVLAGLALVYKRIQAFFQIVQFALIGILFVPWRTFPWAKYLPLSMGRHILQDVLMDGLKLWQVGWGEISVLLVVTALYLSVGVTCFSIAETRARSKGLLGQY